VYPSKGNIHQPNEERVKAKEGKGVEGKTRSQGPGGRAGLASKRNDRRREHGSLAGTGKKGERMWEGGERVTSLIRCRFGKTAEP